MLNDQNSAGFYATWLGLLDDERSELEKLTSDEEFVESAIGRHPLN